MTPRPHAFEALWLAACLAASSLWCLSAAHALGATFDEPLYVMRGLEGWRTGSHAGLLRAGTMPLPIDVATFIPYLAERSRGAPFESSADWPRMIALARDGALFWWLLLLVLGWKIARDLGGAWAGALAIVWLATEPTLLGHASLATTDVAVTACLLGFLRAFRRARIDGGARRFAIASAWLAACVLSKASGLTFVLVTLLAVECEQHGRRGLRRVFDRDVLTTVLGGLALVFLYCGSDWRAEPSFVAWARQLPESSPNRVVGWIAQHLTIFPNAGDALVRQIRHNLRGHGDGSFLLGEAGPSHWYYFPIALSIKATEPLLLLPALVALAEQRALRNWPNAAALALLLVSLVSRVQIGVRFFLPVFALVAIGMTASAVRGAERLPGWRRGILCGALTLGLAAKLWAAIAVWPQGLCYTSELWGGTAGGYHLLSDSNYDWGQGLPELARWQQQHADPPLDVWYFGTDPMIASMPVRSLPLHALPIRTASDVIEQVRGHRLAASTTLVYGTTTNEAHGVSALFLRGLTPVDRTSTFLVFDFTEK